MALATEKLILVSKDSSDGTSSKRSMGRLVLVSLIILLVFQIGGVPAVIVYCLRTFYCCINEKHPHYNCEKSPDGLGQNRAMILELTFACSQVVSRAIFLCVGFKLLKKRGPIWREFFKPLCKLPQTWCILLTLCLCVLRLVFILIDDDDLGEELGIAKATNAMYMIDAFAMTTLLAILNFVKLRDLAKDNVSNDSKELCRVCGIRVTKRGVVFSLLKCVLASFFFQHFAYFAVVTAQLRFEVIEVDKEFVGEKKKKVIIWLKRSGQLAFIFLMSCRLWFKLFDDNTCTVGTKTDEGRKTHQNSESSIGYDSISVSDQTSFEELSLSSSGEYFTASDSSSSEAMQRPLEDIRAPSEALVSTGKSYMSISHELSCSSEYFTASDSSTNEATQTPQRPQSYLRYNNISVNGQSSMASTVV